MIYIWIAVVIILSIIELLTSNLMPIWFSISGVLAIITSIFVNNYIIQFVVFALIGLIFLTVLRPILLKIGKRQSFDRTLK